MRKALLICLLIGILAIGVFGGAVAHADRQCYTPYVQLVGNRWSVQLCVPCMHGFCAIVPPPPPATGGPVGVHRPG